MKRLGIDSDAQLADWSIYFQLLLSDQLKKFRGRHIVIYNGKIVADGEDPGELRRRMSKQLGVPTERFVIAFVEDVKQLLLGKRVA